MLVALGAACSKAKKLQAFESFFYGPCRTVKADNQHYELVSSTGRVNPKATLARRLMEYTGSSTRVVKEGKQLIYGVEPPEMNYI